jgi:hypothetical protein
MNRTRGIILTNPTYRIALLALALCACTPSEPTATQTVTQPPSTPAPSVTPTNPTNAICNELSFYLDPSLASSYLCETVPASQYEFEPYPEHTRVTLQGYPVSGTHFDPQISVYAVSDYDSMIPGEVTGLVTDLQSFTSGGPAPAFSSPFAAPLPFLPRFEAAQAFFSQYKVLPFASGGGIRFLTEYAQYYVPVNNTDLFYTYQGVTSDGLYWISAILPVNLANLPVDADAGFGGQTQEQFSNGYDAYILAAVGQLDATAPASFTPTLDALDALVTSITIAP